MHRPLATLGRIDRTLTEPVVYVGRTQQSSCAPPWARRTVRATTVCLAYIGVGATLLLADVCALCAARGGGAAGPGLLPPPHAQRMAARGRRRIGTAAASDMVCVCHERRQTPSGGAGPAPRDAEPSPAALAPRRHCPRAWRSSRSTASRRCSSFQRSKWEANDDRPKKKHLLGDSAGYAGSPVGTGCSLS